MKRMCTTDANRVFLLSAIVPQGLIYLVAAAGLRDRMALQFLVQVFLAFPAVMYLSMLGIPLKEGIGVSRIGWKEWLLLLPLAVCLDRIATFLNVFSQLFTTNSVGNHMAELILKYPFPIAFFVVAVTPAVCEEVVYRGVLYHGYRSCGKWVAVIVTAALFGIMHTNLNQLCYAFVLGILFALVNEITGSIIPSVFLHLYINGRSVVVLYRWMDKIKEEQGITLESEERLQEYMAMENVTVPEQLAALLPWTVVAVIGVVLILIFMVWSKKRKESQSGLSLKQEGTCQKQEPGGFKTVLSPALFIGILYCIADMIWM